jgi:thioredoxin 1
MNVQGWNKPESRRKRSMTEQATISTPFAVTDADFDAAVLKADTPTLVDFWAAWCGPCLMAAPVLEDIAAENGDRLKIAKLDVDSNQMTAFRYGVQSIPTMILFKDGEPIERIVGFMPKERLMAILERHLP